MKRFGFILIKYIAELQIKGDEKKFRHRLV